MIGSGLPILAEPALKWPPSLEFFSANRRSAKRDPVRKPPAAPRRALHALAEAARIEVRLFESEATLDETLAKLRRVRGIGDWTAQAPIRWGSWCPATA